ncbi:MAG: M24 family metallopeptidase [Myxococcota bacterium]
MSALSRGSVCCGRASGRPGRASGYAAGLIAAVLLVATAVTPGLARADGGDSGGSSAAARANDTRFDLDAVRGILSIKQLDGWLLYDNQGQNPIARELVNPGNEPRRRWFYLIPVRGEPSALVHRGDVTGFTRVPGRKLVYTTHRDFTQLLGTMLKGQRTVAMEYSPRAALPELSRVDAGTIELIRGLKIAVRSSAELVQLVKAPWGSDGRLSHHVAAHHLDELRKAALDFVARKIRAGKLVRERDVQRFLMRGYLTRGLLGPPPIVATGGNTADPHYVPGPGRSAAIKRGDLLLIDMWAKAKSDGRAIYADTTWMAYVGKRVPGRYADAFAVVVRVRDAALQLIEDRTRRRRAIRGYEVDRLVRTELTRAGHGDHIRHRSGHSLDTAVHGAGANLDDFEVRDVRNLVVGSGFSLAPGVYLDGDFGVRTEVNVYLGRGGVEVTTPKQTEITAILAGE